MTVGVLTTSFPQSPGDPAGSFVAAHVAALRELGARVEVIAGRGSRPATHDHGDPRVTRIASTLFDHGGAPDHLERHPMRAVVPAIAFATRLAITAAVRGRRWDSIIAHWLAPSALAALPLRAPLLAIAHGGDVHTLARLGLLRPTLSALERRGAELVFVSESLRDLARRAAPHLDRWLDATQVQPMGIELARFARLARTPTQPPTIVIAARLVPVKGIDVAIAALAHLPATVRLVIAGDGPERATLGARADRLARATGWADRVSFLGAVATPLRDQLLETASCVVVPSRLTGSGRTEGMPMIALEALAAGVPVVASAVGGLAELTHARLVPPEDPRKLAAAIAETLATPPSATELQASVAHLDWRVVVNRLAGVTRR